MIEVERYIIASCRCCCLFNTIWHSSCFFSLNPDPPTPTPQKVFGFAKISWVPFFKVGRFEPTQTHPWPRHWQGSPDWRSSDLKSPRADAGFDMRPCQELLSMRVQSMHEQASRVSINMVSYYRSQNSKVLSQNSIFEINMLPNREPMQKPEDIRWMSVVRTNFAGVFWIPHWALILKGFRSQSRDSKATHK